MKRNMRAGTRTPGRFLAAVFGGALFLAGFSGSGQEHKEARLRLGPLLEEALSRNPAVKSSSFQVEAAKARVPQAGALPDPMLRVGAYNLPVDTFELDQEPMTQLGVGLSQTFPYPGKLKTNTEVSEAALKEKNYREIAVRQKTAYLVRRSFYRLWFLDQAIEITSRNRDLMENLARIAEVKYATGSGLQQDVLKAQVELSRLVDELIFYRQERVREAAELNRLAYRDPESAVSPAEVPGPRPKLPYREQVAELVRNQNPALLAAKAQVEQAGNELALSKLSWLPDFTVTLAYGFRQDGEVNGRKVERPDFLTGSVSIPVSLRKKRKQDQEVAEKEALRQAAFYSEKDLEIKLLATAEELIAEARKLDAQINLLEKGIIPQAAASLDSALAGYKTGKVDFLTLLDNQITLYELELRLARLKADYLKTMAALDWIQGKPVARIIEEVSS